MNKIYKILHKKLDHNLAKDKNFCKRKKQMETVFNNEHLNYMDKDAFSYYQNEIIYQGIHNKKMIEDAYFQGMVKMQDYFEHLDYNEKKRLMNYEIVDCLKDLSYFEYHGEKIYIPFFDERMNQIYQKEMVLFELKQYHRIIYQYEDLFRFNRYGWKIYASSFSSLRLIQQKDTFASLFDEYTNRLFFLEQEQMVEFLTLKVYDEICLERLSDAFFNKSWEEFITILADSKNIDEKLVKKLRKHLT